MSYRIDRQSSWLPFGLFAWSWTRTDPITGAPVPEADGYVRTHAGYPFRWMAELAAKRGTR